MPVGTVPEDNFPVLVLIVSGGHTELVLMHGHCRYTTAGRHAGRRRGRGLRQGGAAARPGLSRRAGHPAAAQRGDAGRFDLPRPLLHDAEHRFDFSFSGLKTAVLNLTRQLEAEGEDLHDAQLAADMAASFQEAVVDVLVAKTVDAARAYGAQQVCICGGVSANARLRELALARCRGAGLPLHIPPLSLCTDNAAMIGAAAHFRAMMAPDYTPGLALDVYANLPLPETA